MFKRIERRLHEKHMKFETQMAMGSGAVCGGKSSVYTPSNVDSKVKGK